MPYPTIFYVVGLQVCTLTSACNTIHWAQAVSMFTRALGIYPGDAEINYNLGVTLQVLGKAQKASQTFASVLDINPQVCVDEQKPVWLKMS